MPPTRTADRRTARAKTGAKSKSVKRQPVKATRPSATPAPSLARRVPSPGFLIVGIGASAGGLEAMEEFFHHASLDFRSDPAGIGDGVRAGGGRRQ